MLSLLSTELIFTIEIYVRTLHKNEKLNAYWVGHTCPSALIFHLPKLLNEIRLNLH